MTVETFGTSGMDGMGIDSLETKKIPEEESTGSKLQREAALLQQGLKQGVSQRISDIIENPGSTALQVVAATAYGSVLGALNAAGGRYGTVARVGSSMVMLYAILQTNQRVTDTGRAMKDVWNDPWKFDESKERVANNFGGLLVDLPMFLAPAAIADRTVGKLVANSMLSRGVEPFVGRPNFVSERPNLHDRFTTIDATLAALSLSPQLRGKNKSDKL